MITATIDWTRNQQVFTDNRYSRQHQWEFDGGQRIPASASPEIVPPPLSDPGGVDPEEAFVAALSSCHMLWFLSLAAEQGLVVDSYRDQATGKLGKNERGQIAITMVTLYPEVVFGGDASAPPSLHQIQELHDEAHRRCFIAQSVRTSVRCEPVET